MASRPSAAGESTVVLYSTEKRCRQKGRGSLYDNVAGAQSGAAAPHANPRHFVLLERRKVAYLHLP